MIAHPECTYLCNSGVKHLYKEGRKENGRDMARWVKMRQAALFFSELWNCTIPIVIIENPVMHGYGRTLISEWCPNIPEPVYFQPWQFGHKEIKASGYYIRGTTIEETENVGPPPNDISERRKWARVHRASPGPDRWKERSRTLPGVAEGLAQAIDRAAK